MRKFFKKLTLTQQLFMIIIAFVVVFSMFFFMFLSFNIDNFVRSQMYSIIKRTQKNIIYNYRLKMDDEILYGANDPNIMHIIFEDDESIITSNNLPGIDQPWLQEVFALTKQQDELTQDYVSKSVHRNMLFTITKIDQKTYVASAISNVYRDEFKGTLLNSTVNILVIVTGVLFLLLMVWVAYIIHPLNQIRSYIEKIKNKEPATLKLDRHDEIGELAYALVEMNEEIERSNKQKDELIQNISHDLKTPIATIRSYSESIKDGVYPYETLSKSVDVILEHVNRLDKKVQNLLLLNRVGYLASTQSEGMYAPMKQVIESAILSLKVIRPNIEIKTSIGDCEFVGLEESWRVVVENLVDNALRYATSVVEITCQNQKLMVYNDGANITQDAMHTIFDAYQKGEDGQFGLGLAIVKKVATSYGYDVYFENVKDGVIFIVEAQGPPIKSKHKTAK